MYRAQRCNTPELVHVPGPFENFYGGGDLVNNVASLNATPVTQEEEHSHSLFSEFEPAVGPSAFDNSPVAGLSVFDQALSTRPSPVVLELPLPGPSTTNEVEPFFTTPSSAIADRSSTLLPAPIPSRPFPEACFLDGTDISILDESAYNHSAFLPDDKFNLPEGNWWELFDSNASATVPSETSQSGPTTPVPTTPFTGFTGYSAPAIASSGYTPGLFTQDLPTRLDENQFAFNDVEGVGQGQLMWNNTYQDFGCMDQQSLAPPAPVLPAAPPAFAPVVAGQVDQMSGFPNDQYLPWTDMTQVLENERLRSAPLFVPDQSAQGVPHVAVQQALDAVNANNFGRDGKLARVGLVGVQLWFLPE